MSTHTDLLEIRFARNLYRLNRAFPYRFEKEFKPSIYKKFFTPNDDEHLITILYNMFAVAIKKPIVDYLYEKYRDDHIELLKVYDRHDDDTEYNIDRRARELRRERNVTKMRKDIIDVVTPNCSAVLIDKLKKYIDLCIVICDTNYKNVLHQLVQTRTLDEYEYDELFVMINDCVVRVIMHMNLADHQYIEHAFEQHELVNQFVEEKLAVLYIQKYWRYVISNPKYQLCKRRLLRENDELSLST